MRMWYAIYTVLVLAGMLLAAAGLLGILGKRLPLEHTSTGSIDLAAPQEEVFSLVNDIGRFPDWCKDFTSTERLPDTPGPRGAPQETWRQHMGRNSFVTVNTEYDPPRKVTRTITDDNHFFSGSWEHTVEPLPNGCRLTIVERGKIPHHIPRALVHYVFGQDTQIRKFLATVKSKTG